MFILTNFLVGFFAAFIGVIPPGLLNMTAAKISMKQGKKPALLFSAGVCFIVCLQTLIALLFARYLDKHPEIVDLLQEVALGIFICLTIYFFFIAKDTRREPPKEVKHSKKNRFFYGMLLAIINLLPLPYWVYVGVTFNTFGWFIFDKIPLTLAVLGSGLGTFVMLFIYIHFFRKKPKNKEFKLNINYLIGIITALISLITLIKVLQKIY